MTFTIKDNIFDTMCIKQKEMYNILIARKFERPYTEKMWERILRLKLLGTDWSANYIYNMKVLEYKNFLNINTNISDCCAFCKAKESIIHILCEYKRF